MRFRYCSGVFGIRLVEAQDPEASFPRNFVEGLITRFQDEGLNEIVSATIKSILFSILAKRIYDDYLPCVRVNFIVIATILISFLPNRQSCIFYLFKKLLKS